MSAPAGWHLQDDGRERFWDGSQWSDQFRTPPGATEQPSEGGLRPDIAAAKSKMRVKFGGGREIKRLVTHLWEGEEVRWMTTGYYGKGNGLIVLTDRRLLFVMDGVMSKQTEDFPLDKISSVQWNSGLAMGTIIVFASGNKAEIKNVQKDDGKQITDLIRARLSGGPDALASPQVATQPAVTVPTAVDPIAQLRQLGELRDAGILTEDEFASKKAEILARM